MTPPEALLLFDCDGPQKNWGLLPEHLAEWTGAYPALDILAECKKAKAWLDADETHGRRKTANGMKRFLAGWLNRAQNTARPPGKKPVPPIGKWICKNCGADVGWLSVRKWCRNCEEADHHRPMGVHA